MSEPTDEHDDTPNDEPWLMTRIDGEEARLLVHIEPIDDAEDAPTEESTPALRPPPDSSGLAQ